MAKKHTKDPAVDNLGFDDDMFSDLDMDDSDLAGLDFGDESDDINDDNRKPVGKLRSMTKYLNAAGESAMAGAAATIAHKVKKAMPEVGSLASEALNVASDVERFRYDVTQQARPVVNQLKITTRQAAKFAEELIPKKAYQKIMEALGPENDERDEKISKDDERKNAMASEMSKIFKAQMAERMVDRRQEATKRIIDDRIASSRHAESTGMLSDIRTQAFFNTRFLKTTFTAYMQKDLELSYRKMYIQEDILESIRISSQMQEERLDAIRHNTSLPDSQKIQLMELASQQMKQQAMSFLTKGGAGALQKFFGGTLKNIQEEYITPMLDSVGTMAEMGSSFLEMLGLEENPDVKKSLAGMAGGAAGGILGSKVIRPILKKLPPDVVKYLETNASMGSQGLVLLLDQFRRGEITIGDGSNSVVNGLQSLLDTILPQIQRENLTVSNDIYKNLDKPGQITNKFIATVEQVIPGYLAKQLAMLEYMAYGRKEERIYDFKSLKFVTSKEAKADFMNQVYGSKEDQIARAQGHYNRVKDLLIYTDESGHTVETRSKAIIKQSTGYKKEIALFIENLAKVNHLWANDNDKPVGAVDLNSIADVAAAGIPTNETIDWLEGANEYQKVAFRGIKDPSTFATFMLEVLAPMNPNTGKREPDQNVIPAINSQVVRSMSQEEIPKAQEYIRRYGNIHLIKDEIFKTNKSGDLVIREDVRRETMDAVTAEDMDSQLSVKYDYFGKEVKKKSDYEELLDRLNPMKMVRSAVGAVKDVGEGIFNAVGLGDQYRSFVESNTGLLGDITSWFKEKRQSWDEITKKWKGEAKRWAWHRLMEVEFLQPFVYVFFDKNGNRRKPGEISPADMAQSLAKYPHLYYALHTALGYNKKDNYDEDPRFNTTSDLSWFLSQVLPRPLLILAAMSEEDIKTLNNSIDKNQICKELAQETIKTYTALLDRLEGTTFHDYYLESMHLFLDDKGNLDVRNIMKIKGPGANATEEERKAYQDFNVNARQFLDEVSDIGTEAQVYGAFDPTERKKIMTQRLGSLSAQALAAISYAAGQSGGTKSMQLTEAQQEKLKKRDEMRDDVLKEAREKAEEAEKLRIEKMRKADEKIQALAGVRAKQEDHVREADAAKQQLAELNKRFHQLKRMKNKIRSTERELERVSKELDALFELLKHSDNESLQTRYNAKLAEKNNLIDRIAQMRNSLDEMYKPAKDLEGNEHSTGWEALEADILATSKKCSPESFMAIEQEIQTTLGELNEARKEVREATVSANKQLNASRSIFKDYGSLDFTNEIRKVANQEYASSGYRGQRKADQADRVKSLQREAEEARKKAEREEAEKLLESKRTAHERHDYIEIPDYDKIPEGVSTPLSELQAIHRVLVETRKDHQYFYSTMGSLRPGVRADNTFAQNAGFVNKPTPIGFGGIAGEHGPEVIVPLNQNQEAKDAFAQAAAYHADGVASGNIEKHAAGGLVDPITGKSLKPFGKGGLNFPPKVIEWMKKNGIKLGAEGDIKSVQDFRRMLNSGFIDIDELQLDPQEIDNLMKAMMQYEVDNSEAKSFIDRFKNWSGGVKESADKKLEEITGILKEAGFTTENKDKALAKANAYKDIVVDKVKDTAKAGKAKVDALFSKLKDIDKVKGIKECWNKWEEFLRIIRTPDAELEEALSDADRRIVKSLRNISIDNINPLKNIDDSTLGAATPVLAKFVRLSQRIFGPIDSVKDFLSSTKDKIESTETGKMLMDAAGSAKDKLSETGGKIKDKVFEGWEKSKDFLGNVWGALKNWLTNESGSLIDIQSRALDVLIAIHGILNDGLVVAGYKTSVQGGQHDIEHTKTFGETVKGWGKKAWDKTKSGVKAVVWDAPMWGVKTVGRAGRDFATNRYCDVYRRPAANQKLGPDLLLIPEEMFKQGVFFDKEGKERVKSVADITQPVYDGNGDPLISAGDIKQGLVDEDEVSITTFGSRAGRIGRSIATAPLRAAHWAGKKIWEKIPGFSAVRKAVSIATAPLAFIKASFSRWVDIYKKDHVKADEVLVTAKDLEAGLLEFYDGTEIKDAHKINKPVIWKNMPANGSRAGNVAISTDDIKDGLVTKNNEPLDRFANKLGGVVNLLARGVGKVAGMVGGGMGAVISGAWSITKKAWDFLSKKKDPYIDVYEKDKIEPGKPLITGKGIREGKYYFADGTQVKSAYGITQAVLDDDGKTCIDEDQIKNGLVDIEGNSLSKWSGRSLIGKVATGLPTVAWHAAKFIGKTAWKGVKAVGRVLGRVLGITSEAADNVAYGIGSFFNGIFGSDRVRRKDLETIVGERLQKIYDLLAMKFGGGVSGDADGDGDRDGSYKDQQEKKKEREAKRRAKTEEFRKKQEAEHMKKLGIAQAPSGESSSSIFGELAEIFGVSAAMDWWKNKKEKAKQKVKAGAASTRGKIASGLSRAGGALKGGATALGGALMDMLPSMGGMALGDRLRGAAGAAGGGLTGWLGKFRRPADFQSAGDMWSGSYWHPSTMRDKYELGRLRGWYGAQEMYGKGVDKLKAMRAGGPGKLSMLNQRLAGLLPMEAFDSAGDMWGNSYWDPNRTVRDRNTLTGRLGAKWDTAKDFMRGRANVAGRAIGDAAGRVGGMASRYGGMAGNALRTAGGFIAPKLAGMAAGASGLLGSATSAIAGAATAAGGALASGLGTAMGAAAGLLTNPVGWAILAAGAAYGGYKLLSWMFSDSKNEKEWKAVRYRAYGTSKKNEDMLEDLEKETLKIIFRQRGELSKEEIEGFAKQCGLVNGGYIFGLIGGDSDKTKDEKTEYFTTWYTKRFRPIFEAYAKIVANATGKYDSIDVDAIPAEKYKECITSFKGEVSRITGDKLVKDLVPNVAGYTKYQRAKKLEEASKLREGGKEGDVNGIIGKMKQAQLDREHEKRVKDDVKAGGAVGALASMELERIQERRKANRKGLKGFLLNAKDFALKWGKMLLGISALEWLGEAFGIIDTKENKLWKQARYDYYGIDVKLQADAMDDFEKEMLPVVDGDEDPPEDVSEWMDRFGLNGIVTRNVANKAGGYFFDPRTHLARAIQGVGKLAGGIASMFNTKEDDEKEDLKKEYFERWMYGRFFPIYDAYVTTVRELTGTEPGDKVNVDKIKKRDQRKALGQFTETAKGIIDNDPEMKNILPTPEGFEKWYKDQKAKADAKKAKDEEATKNELAGITGAGNVALSDEELQKKKDNREQLSATEEARLSLNQRLQDQKAREGETAIGGFFREADGMLNDAGRFLARWTLALPYRMLGFDVANSKETYEWRAVRAEYYGLKEKDLNSAMRDFEEDVLEIVDGEEPEMDEDTLRKYYRMIMLGDYNSSIARGIMNVGRAIGSLFNNDEEDDLEDERFAYFCTWYAKRFRPLYELYVNTVRAVTEGEPGDEPDVDDIPEELYVKTLSTFMRSADNFLGKDPNTKKLIPTIEGFEAYLEEKEAAQAKQQMGETPPPPVDVMAGAILDKEEEKKKEEYEAARLGQQATHEAMKQAKKDNEESQASIADRILSGLTELANSEIFTNPGAALANVGWKIVDWLFGDSENVQNWKRIKYEGYGVDPKKHRSAITDLEDDVLDIIDGKKAEFTEDELKDIAEDFGLIDQGSFFKLLGGDSEEVIRERMNYFSTWYATRFRPIFESYVKIIRAATGYEASFWTSATPDPDGIQDNMQQKVLEQFKKQVDAIVGRGEVKKFGPDLESFEKYKQAKKEEEARQRAAATADGNQAAASALAEKKAEEKEAADRAKANEAQREANEQAKKQAEAAANSSSAGGSGTNGADPNNSGGATDVINKAANATFETSSSAGSGGAAGGGGGSDGSTGDSTPSEAGKTVTKLNLKGLGDIKPMDENVLAAQFANMKLTRGKRNNNPGNVIVTSWTRKRPGFIDGDRVKGGKGAAPYGKGNTGMARFSAPEFGIATALTLTKDTYGKQGLNTIRKITHKYSPPHENNTAQLIRQYSKASGFKPDEKINWENQEAIKRYMAEKFRMESSIKFPDDVMNRAFALVYGGSEGATGETQDGSMNPGNGTASSSDSNTGGSAAQGASGDAGSSTGAGNATGGGDAGGSTGGGGGSSAGGAGASAGGGAASSGDAQQQANDTAKGAPENPGAAGSQSGGQVAGGKGYVRPTNSNVITSPFGPRNVPGGSKNHKGIDLRARQGQPIYAAGKGKVVASTKHYGTIAIEHPDGMSTEYMHLSKRNVKDGDQVSAGQEIGAAGGVGAGGLVKYVPHLHFGVAKGKFNWKRSNWIDPEPWLKSNQINVSRKGMPGNNDMAPLSDADAEGKTGNEQSAEALGQEVAKKDPSAVAPENTKGTTPEANANAQMSQTIKDNPPAGNSGDSAASASASAATANAGSAAGGGTDTGVAVASDTPSQTGSVGSNGGDTELAELKLMRGVLEGIREDMRGYFGNGSSSGGSGGGDSSSGGGSSDNKTTEAKKEEKKDDAQQAKLKDAFNKYSGQDEQQKKLGNLFETMKNQGAQKDLGNAFNKYSDMGKQQNLGALFNKHKDPVNSAKVAPQQYA